MRRGLSLEWVPSRPCGGAVGRSPPGRKGPQHPSGFPTRHSGLVGPQRLTVSLAGVIKAVPAPRERPDSDRRCESRPTQPASVAPVPRPAPRAWPSAPAGGIGTGGPILPTGWSESLRARATRELPLEVGRVPAIGAIPSGSIIAALFCRFALPPTGARQRCDSSDRCLPFHPVTVASFVRSGCLAANGVGSFARFSEPPSRHLRGRFAEFRAPDEAHWLRFVIPAGPRSSAVSRHFGRSGFVSRISKAVLAPFGFQVRRHWVRFARQRSRHRGHWPGRPGRGTLSIQQ
jgi:hypothetical protein